MASPRLNAAEQQVNCDDSQVNAPCAVKGQELTANSQEPVATESLVNAPLVRLIVAGRQVNCIFFTIFAKKY